MIISGWTEFIDYPKNPSPEDRNKVTEEGIDLLNNDYAVFSRNICKMAMDYSSSIYGMIICS